MSGLALYGTCEAHIGEEPSRQSTPNRPIYKPILCGQPATHQATDHESQLRLCDEHTHQVLRDPGHATVRRLDQGGTG